VFSPAQNSNKFQQTRFWKEKSVENVVTLEGLPFNLTMKKKGLGFRVF
jgi:hypothetical protein